MCRHKKLKCRLIIVKAYFCNAKSKIVYLKILKDYNDSNSEASSSGSQSNEHKVYITDHLSPIFYLQKQQLINDFKGARKADLKILLKVEDGSYNLFIDGLKGNPSNLVKLISAIVLLM